MTYQPWHLFTFHLCGCCCCEAPRFDRTIRVRWSHSLARWRPKGRGNVLFRHFNPHRWTDPDDPKAWLSTFLRHGLDCLEFGKDYLLPWFMTEIQFPNTTSCGFDCIYIWRHDIWYPWRLWLIFMIVSKNQKLFGNELGWMVSWVLVWCWFRPSGLILRESFSY